MLQIHDFFVILNLKDDMFNSWKIENKKKFNFNY